MAVKKKTSTRRSAGDLRRGDLRKHNGSTPIRIQQTPRNSLPLRTQTATALENYFSHLNGDQPAHLYELVLREVEEPLFRAVLHYVDGNQSRAAEVLGLNRGTLRKKLRTYRLNGE